MDKYEYKVRTDEIKDLIARKEYVQAAEIADTIDWRRVKSVMMLCTISDLYKINRRYEDSRDLLLMAYDKHPTGRMIVYALCELAIKMGELPKAVEFCKEYVQLAPKDPGRYILQYKIYEAQEVGLEERIAVLEELKKRDYREKWAYELAYLYHRIGFESKCVDECDELIVWFGEGKYVIRAMELKMLHQPLTPEQQEKYDRRFAPKEEEAKVPVAEETVVIAQSPQKGNTQPIILDEQEEEQAATTIWSAAYVEDALENSAVANAETIRIPTKEIDIQVKTMDPTQCNTINLQEEVAAGLRELWENKSQDDEITRSIVAPMLETDSINRDEVEQALETIQAEKPVVEDFVEEKTTEMPKGMERVLSMEADGQISFVVEEKETVEKQITGQISISDIMAEWERMKKELEEKNREQIRQQVKDNTGQMFTDFETSVRDGLLEQLEQGVDMDEVIAHAQNVEWEKEGLVVPHGLQDVEELSEETELPEVEAETDPVDVAYEAALAGASVDISQAELSLKEVYEDEQKDEPVISFETETDEPEEEPEARELEEEFIGEEIEVAELEEEFIEEEIEVAELEEEFVEEEKTEVAELKEEFLEEEETEVAELKEEFLEEEESEVAELEEEFVEEEETEVAEPEEEFHEEEESEVREPEEESVQGEVTETQIPEKETSEEDAKEDSPHVRKLTKEERDLFSPYIQGKNSKAQLLHALDNISMAAYTGNVIITGSEGLDTLGLAKSIIRYIQMTDNNFSGKTAKISGSSLNKREVNTVLEGLVNGGLIIQKAADMNEKTVANLYKIMQQEHTGMVVVLEGTRKTIDLLLKTYPKLSSCFTARIDMEVLSNKALVAFSKKYAREKECSIDELGILELHRIITERQTNEHAVTLMEVKEIMDDAIESATKKSVGHFVDLLMSKRYDEEDMIVIREKDFM